MKISSGRKILAEAVRLESLQQQKILTLKDLRTQINIGLFAPFLGTGKYIIKKNLKYLLDLMNIGILKQLRAASFLKIQLGLAMILI